MSSNKIPVRRHRIQHVEYSNTNHRLVYMDIYLAPTQEHVRYTRGLAKFPVTPPTAAQATVADKMFNTCLENRTAPEKQKRKTEAQSWETQQLKKRIQTRLKADKETRLDQAATKIKMAIEEDTKRGYHLLSHWYKKRESQGIALSQEVMGKVEEEYTALYALPTTPAGKMIPLLARGLFQVEDTVPEDMKIRLACRKLQRGRAPGPSGLKVDKLQAWEEEEDRTNWKHVVQLVQHAFCTGESPATFKWRSLVLIPKVDAGKYWGIALLESIY